MYHQVKLFLLTCFQDIFEFYGQYKKFAKVIKVSQGLVFHFYYTFYWLLSETYLEPGRTSTMKLFWRKYLTVI